ncbi:MAG: hypothetical protein ABSG59_17685 [Verrucomicrobiota bacterium]|jgi:hypothetical protein
MKNRFKLTNLMRRSGRCGLALSGLLLLAIAASSSAAEILPPSSLPYGYSYEEWSAKYVQWALGQSTDQMEVVGWPGICSGPASRVRFLGGPLAPGAGGISIVTYHDTTPAGTPLFFPILDAYSDNTACPLSDFTSLTAEQLAAESVESFSFVTETSCTIDGVSVAGMEDPTNSVYNVVSPPFSYTTAEKDNVLAGLIGEPCIPGGMTIYPAVADGVWLMLSPLSPGRHTIHTVGVVSVGGVVVVRFDLTYDLTVTRDQDGGHDRDNK